MKLWAPYEPLTPTQRRLLALGSFATVLGVWLLVSLLDLVSSNKLPSPLEVAQAFGYLSWNGETSMLLKATLASLSRIALAAALVNAIGIPIGVLMGSSPTINSILSPLVDPFRSAPVVALLPILVMWLGIGEEMKVSFLFIGAVVYLIPMVRDAVVAVPYSYWESAKDLGATDFECITRGVLPIALPRIADAMIVAVSVMWTYITVAEYVNADSGLGQLIQNARRFSAMDQVFVGIIVIIAMALVTYQLMTYAKRKLFFWETQQ